MAITDLWVPREDRPARRRPAGRARADGRRHQRRLPPAVPLVRRRASTSARWSRRARSSRATETTARHAAFGPDEQVRSVQLYGVDPAVVGEAVRRLVERGRRRPRRPQHRLPVAEGHPARRRRRASGAPPAVLGTSCAAAVQAAGVGARHGEDAQGRRRRDPDLPRGRPRRRRTRARPRSRCTRAPPSSSTPGAPTGPRSRELKDGGRPTSRCSGNGDVWAGAGRAADDGGTPAATASSSAAAASASRGCSATSPTPSPGARVPPPPRWARSSP